MENQIKKLLDDLYKLDNGLKQHEEKLIKIIKELLASRPDTAFSPEFAQELRTEILRRARELGEAGETSVSWIKFMNLSKLTYALAGAALAVLIILPAVALLNRAPGAPFKLTSEDSGSITGAKIAKLKSNAFGSLQSVVGGNLQLEGRGAAESAPAVSAGNIAPKAGEQAPLGLGGGGTVSSDMSIGMPAPDIINYKYVYTGEGISSPDSSLPVYRQTAGSETGKSLSGMLSSFNFGWVDLDKFRDRFLTNFTITEDREFGYQVNFDMRNNNLSINSNWEKWPQAGSECQDEACFRQYRLTENDVPSDQELIAIADKFLKDYGINTGRFGPGQAAAQWKDMLYRSENSEVYIPDIITVVYPEVVEGKTVYDESGYPSGLSVNVNIRYDRVSDVYGLKFSDYERSDYEAETDTARLVKYAEAGGRYGNYNYPDAAKTVEIKLGEPKLSLIRYWHYDGSKFQGEELLVPAYIFPITEKPEGEYLYRESVTVPLIKELLDEAEKDFPIGIPQPVPLLEIDGPDQPQIVEEPENSEGKKEPHENDAVQIKENN